MFHLDVTSFRGNQSITAGFMILLNIPGDIRVANDWQNQILAQNLFNFVHMWQSYAKYLSIYKFFYRDTVYIKDCTSL